MKQKSLGLNAVLNGIKQCCSIIFPLITFPYISRVLGNDGYGKYSFSYSVTNYFILLAALGIYTYAIREGAKVRDDQKEVDKFCSQVFSINVCSAAISLLLLSIMVFCLPKFSGYKAYIFIQSTAIIMAVIGTDWVNGIFEDYFYITVRYIAVQCVCLIAMFVFVRKPEDIIPYCIISVLATNGGNLINVFYVRKYAKIRFTFDMDLKRHLVSLLILFVNSIAISIYVNSDITMLGFFESDAQVGVYSFASKIYNLLKQLINAVIVVSVPRIAYIMDHALGLFNYPVIEFRRHGDNATSEENRTKESRIQTFDDYIRFHEMGLERVTSENDKEMLKKGIEFLELRRRFFETGNIALWIKLASKYRAFYNSARGCLGDLYFVYRK